MAPPIDPGATVPAAPVGASVPPLSAAMAGVRALLLDLDGVIVVAGAPVPGAAEALGRLEARRLPYRIVTNTSAVSRATLARLAEGMGAAVPASRFQSALSATAAWTARRFPDSPLYVLASEDARQEFAGQRLLRDEEAGARGARAAAVVIGDSPEAITFDNLDRAFRLVRGGARLVGMHRNPWWLTADGPTLDSGAFVAGLEFATGVRATILGKPSPAFFSAAVAALREEAGRDLPRARIAMVGDDVRTDVLAAQRTGLRGIFVLSGKHGPADLEGARRARGGRAPDGIGPSIAEVVAALEGALD